MKFLVLFMTLVSISHSSFADDHSQFPPDALLVLEGVDAISKQTCHLFVMDAGYSGDETPANFFATVLTSYSHDAQAAESITLRFAPDRPQTLMGIAANGKDQMAVFLSTSELDLRFAQSFNLKWWHGNHFHNNRCENLIVHQH